MRDVGVNIKVYILDFQSLGDFGSLMYSLFFKIS